MPTIETDVALLQQEVGNHKELINRITETTDKIGEVSQYMAKILAVHDERLQTSEARVDDLSVQLDNTEKRIMAKLDAMREAAGIDKDEIDKRLRTLENWRWMLVGGGIVLGFVMGKIPFLTTLFQAASHA